jgi:hypothetical protein
MTQAVVEGGTFKSGSRDVLMRIAIVTGVALLALTTGASRVGRWWQQFGRGQQKRARCTVTAGTARGSCIRLERAAQPGVTNGGTCTDWRSRRPARIRRGDGWGPSCYWKVDTDYQAARMEIRGPASG